MTKSASVTIRIPEALKLRIAKRASREHRSLSAQVEHELTRVFEDEPVKAAQGAGSFLGVFATRKAPTDKDIRQARKALWSRLQGS